MEASKQVLGGTVRTFSCGLQAQERHLADIQHQLEEAHRLEENMKRDLKRISKDIDVLQRQDLDVRNEISTQKKRFLHQRSVQVNTNVTISCIKTPSNTLCPGEEGGGEPGEARHLRHRPEAQAGGQGQVSTRTRPSGGSAQVELHYRM